ncbi:inorganic pyrophosphatase [Luteibacter phage vB_LflM-Pluto]|uniref:Inorganic pyrophosphatase n=1 Tax=Luteibacter phage vB_LflM-Pluto TaxID=2948611 RepID=A0A9E7MUJ1_9CAUD|nr:inorganic pyrophosphatase [Luteibacter phage vB_LflM-Pluto]
MTDMLNDLLRNVFQRRKAKAEAAASDSAPPSSDTYDPLEPLGAFRSGTISMDSAIRHRASDFMLEEDEESLHEKRYAAMDSALTGKSMDASCFNGGAANIANENIAQNQYSASPVITGWYASQSFIGYQACAVIAQHWLVDKACKMAGEDAIRNGWDIKAKGSVDLSDVDKDRLRSLDVEYKVMENLAEMHRFKNIFGIRVLLFEVDSDDRDYYEKPFNPDGITKGSYKGMSQVDPYWMMPMLTAESTANPASRHFYDPEFWIISGKKYHRSHLIICRGPQPADILKPTYIFGGIPLVQRIYERVYAAERTANEAPLLAMSKRTSAIHTDLAKVATKQEEFEERILTWIKYRDNHAVKVLGQNEVMEQFDTSLADFDAVIMNQYQLVSAIAEVPSTKLLGTSPKGFNATGEFEMKSYHEKLTSIQTHEMEPALDRHYLLLSRSEGIIVELSIVWESVDSPTAQEKADLNAKKAETDERLANLGAISPDDVRNRLKDDKHSGYNRLNDDAANPTPGMTPENLAELEKASAEETSAETPQESPSPAAGATPAPEEDGGAAAPVRTIATAPAGSLGSPTTVALREPGVNEPKEGEGQRAENETAGLLRTVLERLTEIEEHIMPEGIELDGARHVQGRSTQPSTSGITPTTVGIKDVIGAAADPSNLPKLKLHGMVLVVENPRGSIRKGQRLDGVDWSAKMADHYGFIKGVMGADGDELDCFVGSSMNADKVYVVNQNDMITGEFDEHKCMIGYDSPEAAKKAYDDSYDKGWTGYDSMFSMSVEDFKNWCKMDGACASPLNEACIGATNSFPMTDGV